MFDPQIAVALFAAFLLGMVSARPGCIPATTTERATTESLPADKEKPAPTPEQLDPGLAPGVGASPKIY